MHVFLKPKEGLKVHNPKTKLFLKAEGERVELTKYWRNRLRDKDVVEIKVESKDNKNVSTKGKQEDKETSKK